MQVLAIGRAAALVRAIQPPPMPRQVGRGHGRGRASLPPPPPGLAAIYCLPATGVALSSSLNFKGEFEVSPMLRNPALSRVLAEDSRSSPVVRRYGFPEAETDPLRSPPPLTSEQRSPSPAAALDEDLLVNPPVEWVREEQQPRIRVRPTREAGAECPGCWNCGQFGHSRIDCTRPRQSMCDMCGRPGLTIATCPTCCQD